MAQKTPFPRICIALGVTEPTKLLEQARREAEAGESFLEIRLDYLERPERGCEVIRKLLQGHPECMVLATCRRHQNHGRYNGGVEEQIRILDAAVRAGAKAVDVEVETAETAGAKLDLFHGRARLLISYHNFESTPPMEAVLKRMLRIPADAYKLVTTARKPSDNLRVCELAKSHPRAPLVVLAMGETGFPTRVISPALGGLFTYAAPISSEGTASGQVSARQLRHLYRADKLSRSAKIYGVIANPVRHSISPAVHNRAFQSRRLDAVYLPFLVAPPQLRDFFQTAKQLPIAGFSVTIPHKQKILRYLDVVEAAARRIGAVNTVWRKAGKWRGGNTDVEGITVPLARRLKLCNSTVLVAGNGGAARGAVCALSDAGAKVFLTGRNPDRVRALSKICGAEAVPREQAARLQFDALIHATPLGMFPHVNECFFDSKIPAEVVFDMVYNPLDTLLIQRAREQGKVVIRGVDMFVEQAVRQFEIWTGESAPRAAMERAAMEALKE